MNKANPFLGVLFAVFLYSWLHGTDRNPLKKGSSFIKSMAQSAGSNSGKKLVQVDITSDSVCPWCYVGKKNLEKAMDATKDRFDFEVRWHPFFLNPDAPKEGVNKIEFYKRKFGSRADAIHGRMAEIFKSLGMDYTIEGLIGSTMDSHRLIYLAGQQGLDKQNSLVEEMFHGYFTEGKFIGDKEFLLECAAKARIEGAAEFIEDPNKGLKEVTEELKKYSSNISGVPHFVINGKYELSGGQPPEVFQRTFETSAK